MIDGIYEGLVMPLIKQQDDLVLKKLNDIGVKFKDLSELVACRFPKLCRVKKDGWMYWFYDNGTRRGMFLVAFSDIEVGAVEGNSVRAFFNTKETYNGELDAMYSKNLYSLYEQP